MHNTLFFNEFTGFLLRVIYPAMMVHVHGYRRGRLIFIIPRVG